MLRKGIQFYPEEQQDFVKTDKKCQSKTTDAAVMEGSEGTRMVKDIDIKKYKAELINTDRSSVMMVCINGIRENVLYGKIVSCHIKGPIEFKGIDQLILAIDEVCERVGQPKQSTNPRFLKKISAEHYIELASGNRKGDLFDGRGLMEPYFHQVSNAKEIMIIQVLFRQNSSMQGRILCSYSNKKYVSFRSALELMRMLSEIEIDLREV